MGRSASVWCLSAARTIPRPHDRDPLDRGTPQPSSLADTLFARSFALNVVQLCKNVLPIFSSPPPSVPARAWRQSGPPDPGSSECRAVARLRPASVWTLAAPDRAGTPSKPVPRAAPLATSPGPMLRSPQRSFGRCPALPVTRPSRSSATRSIDNSLGGFLLHW